MWANSAHADKVDTALNQTMRHVSGCIRATNTEMLSPLAGMLPHRERRSNILSNFFDKNGLAAREQSRIPRRDMLSACGSLNTRYHPDFTDLFELGSRPFYPELRRREKVILNRVVSG